MVPWDIILLPFSEVGLPASRFSVVFALLGVVVLVPVAAGAEGPAVDLVVAVTDVSSTATEDNGQQKLALTPDGTLFLAYSAPNPDAGQFSGSKYAGAGDAGESVFVARSNDEGATWTTEARLSRDHVPARLAAIAAGPDGSVHASWVDFETVGHVWHAVRDNGAWQPGEKVSPGPFYAGFPALAIGEDAVHLLWYAAPPDQETDHGSRYEIRHTIDSGQGWATPVLVSTNSQDALNPTVVRDRDGVIHTAWYQVWVNTYRANYASWNGEWQVPKAVSSFEANATGVAMDVAPDGTVHLVWEQVTGADLGVAYSRLQSEGWSEIEILSERGARDPVIASDDAGRVFAAWSRDGEIESRLLEGGWGPATSLGPGAHPSLLAGEVVRAAWTRPSGGWHEIVIGTLGGVVGDGPGILPLVVTVVALALAAVALAFLRRRSAAG